MRNIFVSYARVSADTAKQIAQDIERLGFVPWLDNRLSGGQNWWDEILNKLRNCDLLIFLLDSDSLQSDACRREYQYASALGKPIIPVLVTDKIEMNLLPREIAGIQFVDYRKKEREPAIELAKAINRLPQPSPLPDPMPAPPSAPFSYLHDLSERIDKPSLSRDEQSGLLVELKRALAKEKDRNDAHALLQRLWKRHDLLASVDAEIEELLGDRQTPRSNGRRRVRWAIAAAVLVAVAGTAFFLITTQQLHEPVIPSEPALALESDLSGLVEASEQDGAVPGGAAIKSEPIGAAVGPSALAALSERLLDEGDPILSLKAALAAWSAWSRSEAETMPAAVEALRRALPANPGADTSSIALRGHDGGITTAIFSPDGSEVVTVSEDETARLWDAGTGTEIATLRGHEGPINSAAFSPDGSMIITASDDSTVRAWDARTGAEIAVLRGHEGVVWTAEFSSDGSRIITASGDATARLWDVATMREVMIMRPRGGIIDAVFSPDGGRIMTLRVDGTMQFWDATTGDEIVELRAHSGMPVNSASFSHNGRYIVSAGDDGTALIWDIEAGIDIEELQGHSGGVWSASFSPDDSMVLTASYDGTARLWNVVGGNEIALLGGFSRVWSAEFSPDGNQVATAYSDGTARLWDAATGAEIAQLIGHQDRVYRASFSPDGRQVLTASQDGTARLWDIGDLAGLSVTQIACDRLPDFDLTAINEAYQSSIRPICQDM